MTFSATQFWTFIFVHFEKVKILFIFRKLAFLYNKLPKLLKAEAKPLLLTAAAVGYYMVLGKKSPQIGSKINSELVALFGLLYSRLYSRLYS